MCSINLYAQYARPSVALKVRPTNRSIKLRWAPTNPALWKLANKYGYTIERTKIMQGGKFTTQETKLLTPTPIKPASPDLWKHDIEANDYVAVSAQAIYGETFELSQNNTLKIVNVVSAARELESRYSFAVFAADQSIRAATLSGLFYEDEMIEPHAKYLYKVFANIPPEVLEADTGIAYTGIDDFSELPRISDVQVISESDITTVSWDGALVVKEYNAFWVERSLDSVNFKRANKRPVLNTFFDDRKRSRRVFYNDSVTVTNKRVYYRVVGVNAFEEVGPPSEIRSVTPFPTFFHRPSIIGHSVDSSGFVQLHWNFSHVAEDQLRRFSLQRMDVKSKRTSIVRDSISVNERSIKDKHPRATNYYVLVAHDRHGRQNGSFPYLVQLEDSIPPEPPVDLKGKIDTTGVVTISWEPNDEADLHGYIIYRSNFLSEEFLQVSKTIGEEPLFVDSISLLNLTETIHYRVVALDRRFNPSGFSEILTLKKPDKIPPSAPVLKSIRNDSLGIYLEWAESASEDVRSHLVYRRSDQETEWTLVHIGNSLQNSKHFLDIGSLHGKYYEYTIIAVDDDGLESTASKVVGLKRPNKEQRAPISSIDYKISSDSIFLRWTYDYPDTQSFRVYLKYGESFALYQEVIEKSCVLKISDSRNSRLEFFLVARFKNGEMSKHSKIVAIER